MEEGGGVDVCRFLKQRFLAEENISDGSYYQHRGLTFEGKRISCPLIV